MKLSVQRYVLLRTLRKRKKLQLAILIKMEEKYRKLCLTNYKDIFHYQSRILKNNAPESKFS